MPDVEWQIGSDEAIAYVVPLHAVGEALTVLYQAGFAARSVGNEMPDMMQGHVARGHAHASIVVPSAQAAEASELLRAWEHAGDERVKGHLKRVPLDLLRVVLVIGLVFLVAWILTGTWRTSRVGSILIPVVVGAGLIGEWLRYRHRRRARAAVSADPVKKGSAWFDPKSGRVKRRG